MRLDETPGRAGNGWALRADPGEIDWIVGLFPVVAAPGGRVTLMFTDIEGFTAYAASRGDRAAMRLLRHHDAAALPAIRRYGGRIVKRLGDGLMVAFDLPADALAAGLAIQGEAARRGRVRLRIGIHAGQARAREGDLVGHDVNVAARIAERAAGSQVLVSDAVRRAAARIPATFRRTRSLAIEGRERMALFSAEAGRAGVRRPRRPWSWKRHAASRPC